MVRRSALMAAIALLAMVALADSAEAQYWRRGWRGYRPYPMWGSPWGWYGWPPGGYSGPSNVWYVPPLAPELSVVLPRKRCAAGRTPARWVKVRKDGREVWRHVMSRCR